MRPFLWRLACGMAWLMLVSAPARSEDDLSVVKRAMARDDSRSAASPRAEADALADGREHAPHWLKIRVLDKSGRQARVAVNVPLGLVKALEATCRWILSGEWRATDDRGRRHRAPTIREVLGMLQAGQEIVEIESEEARVRVWVE
jgi:hypothetical protein